MGWYPKYRSMGSTMFCSQWLMSSRVHFRCSDITREGPPRRIFTPEIIHSVPFAVRHKIYSALRPAFGSMSIGVSSPLCATTTITSSTMKSILLVFKSAVSVQTSLRPLYNVVHIATSRSLTSNEEKIESQNLQKKRSL
jgi:hypothetical protein